MLFLMDSNGKVPEVDVKNHPLMERIVEILRELRKIKKLEEELDQEVEKLAEVVKNNDHLRYEFGNYLYWNSPMDDYLKLKKLFKIMCTGESHIGSSAIRPLVKKYYCPQCQETKEVAFKSRTEIKTYHNRKSCEECEKRKNERIGEEWRKQKEQNRQENRKRQERAEELKKMPYSEYLQTEDWKRTSYLAKKRAGFLCELCNSKKDLETHHRNYKRLGEEDAKDLIVLCHDCHDKFHKEKKLNK